jgi:hypothetical protein
MTSRDQLERIGGGWGLTYPFKTSLVLFSEFELDFVQKLLNIQCVHGPHGKENPNS